MEYKRLVCSVCGNEFQPYKYDRYTVKSTNTQLFNVVDAFFDVFDCPRCGCQVIAKERIMDGEHESTSPISYMEDSSKQTYNVAPIQYSSRMDAEVMKNRLLSEIDKYGILSINDYNEILGIKKERYGANYGWLRLDGLRVARRDGEYILCMPVAVRIK